ncbi:Uncharacterised protein [Salmonella enterica subsp. arizonae]|uniref:Uncharacterized protein n=1 Tax=Salmonella enterica subsp. arizonae TaxID=59203 RepID=A0A379RY53_SALER|nr:Uncharacterised protein [Salmonella enterica subsp. arizonae]
MAIGFWVVQGDKTTCGGSVLTGHPKGEADWPESKQTSNSRLPGILR